MRYSTFFYQKQFTGQQLAESEGLLITAKSLFQMGGVKKGRVVLREAKVFGEYTDVNGGAGAGKAYSVDIQCRITSNDLPSTRNLSAVVLSVGTVQNFSEIIFSSWMPLITMDNDLLLPPSFVLNFNANPVSNLPDSQNGDLLNVFFTLGYDIL